MWNPGPDYVWMWFEMCNSAADKKKEYNKSCAIGQLSGLEENVIREVVVKRGWLLCHCRKVATTYYLVLD